MTVTEQNSLPDFFPFWFQRDWDKLNLTSKQVMPHALLFSGPDGIGKSQFLHHLSAALLCQNNADNGHACGQCSDCQLFKSGNHADFYLLKTLEEKKSIGIEQIREIAEWIFSTRHQSQKKVLYLPQTEKLTIAASNALLKTLEEPSAASHILLQTNNSHQLLATIRSRCIHYKLSAPTAEQSIKWLNEQQQTQHFKQMKLADLSAISGNAPLRALQLINSDELELRENLYQQLTAIAINQESAVLAAKALDHKQVKVYFYWLYYWIIDLIKVQSQLPLHYLSNKDYADRIAGLGKTVHPLALFALANEINQYYKTQQIVLNTQLLLETYLIKWSNCCKFE